MYFGIKYAVIPLCKQGNEISKYAIPAGVTKLSAIARNPSFNLLVYQFDFDFSSLGELG